ncbi:hypothetical protein VSO52_05105 [Pseudomonas fulva]|uniref:hypothetical protein n=1 Tax=Pseudomonas fulva TaxID=47880 RepID=UPI002DB66C07|nr:hypothetical protein [Pseudomonas fulva]MEC4022164.1 hypothetical protein [Pseudomonas fulva]
MDTNKMRQDFEAAFIAEQVAKFGEGFRDSAIHLLKRDGAFLTNPSFYEVRRREQGMYDNYWVEMVWWAWQASREAVVVELPSPMDAPPYASYEGGWNDMRDEAVDGIEEQGLKVKAREVKP